jgi:methylthioribulose-1-phosphate dehydratase
MGRGTSEAGEGVMQNLDSRGGFIVGKPLHRFAVPLPSFAGEDLNSSRSPICHAAVLSIGSMDKSAAPAPHSLFRTADADAAALAAAADAIVAAGRRLDARGLAPATAGNYSVKLADGTIAVTVSGAHKGRLAAGQVMRVDGEGAALDGRRPSAETLLHCLIYALDGGAGGVLHTHSVTGVVLSRALADADAIGFDGYEMLKIFPGIDTHATSLAIPLVDNSQDMAALAAALRPRIAAQDPIVPAFYIRGHGLYAWGRDLAEAENMVEAVEYLLACEWEAMKLGRPAR